VCYSGQCYLSQSIGGRSGNRGECAQPCRKFYTLEDAGRRTLAQGHLLSLKDMNRAEHLPDLIGAGINSFKIEGRLKDAAYVANVVGHYRLALDAAMAGLNTEAGEKRFCAAAAGKTELGFTPDPTKTFNRGYTPYFLHGRPESREPLLGEPRSPKMIGEVIGAVEGVQGEWVALNSALAHPPTLRNGDGVCWFDGEGILLGALINAVAPLTHGQRVRLGNVTPPPVGTALYRNHDHAFLNQLDPAPAQRRIAMTMRLLQAEGALRLEARDADGCMAEVLHEGEIRMAERAETMRATWERQLAKTGETEFTCERVELPEADMPFLPISTINQLRREVLDALRTARLRNRPLLKPGVAAADHPYPERELTFEGNVLNHFAANFYRRHGVGTIEPAAESGRVNLHGKRVMQTRHCLRRQLGECPHDTVEAHHARHLPSPATPLWLVDAEGHRVRLKFNCADCLSATAEAPVAMELRLE
jgi:putative protease